MIAGQYAVSIQWGAGHHYFVWTGDSSEKALSIGAGYQATFAAKRPRHNLKPAVYVWSKMLLPPVTSK